MKNKSGEITVGAILIGFIGILVGLIILQGTFPYIGQTTNTYSVANKTITNPAVGSSIDLVGQELLSTPVVTNRTSGTVVTATNYTIGERVSPVDGLKRVYFQNLGGSFNGVALNVSYDYGQEGYIDDAGGRATTGLIPIMGALALLMAALAIVIKEKFF